jgi:hypothetical protein
LRVQVLRAVWLIGGEKWRTFWRLEAQHLNSGCA